MDGKWQKEYRAIQKKYRHENTDIYAPEKYFYKKDK